MPHCRRLPPCPFAAVPVVSVELPDMRIEIPSALEEDTFAGPRRRRVGGWIIALALAGAAVVIGWGVVKPYVIPTTAEVTPPLDARAHSFLATGERDMEDGDFEEAQEAFDKASALAERDPRVLRDQARLATPRPYPLARLRLLPADAVEEMRIATRQLDKAAARAKRAADLAVSATPDDPIAVSAMIDVLRLRGEQEFARRYVAKVVGQAGQAEVAYVMAALDLAEAEPIWSTVVERLRRAAAGENHGGRARAALVYALGKSGDGAGAAAELAKLDAFARPYPLLPNLHAWLDRNASPTNGQARGTTSSGFSRPVASAMPSSSGHPSSGVAATVATTTDGVPTDSRLAMEMASAAFKRGDWTRPAGFTVQSWPKSRGLRSSGGQGDVERVRGHFAAAIAAYKRALAVNPSYLPALTSMADCEWDPRGPRLRAAHLPRHRRALPRGNVPSLRTRPAEGSPGSGNPSPGHGNPSHETGAAPAAPPPATTGSDARRRSVRHCAGAAGRPARLRGAAANSSGNPGRFGWCGPRPRPRGDDLSGGAPERTSGGPPRTLREPHGLRGARSKIDAIKGDAKVKGVLVRLGAAHVGMARAAEIGELLAGLGSKVPVWCHADSYGNATVLLAARGCRRISASPAGDVDAVGLAVQLVYFTGSWSTSSVSTSTSFKWANARAPRSPSRATAPVRRPARRSNPL